jgi:hypothetical protein
MNAPAKIEAAGLALLRVPFGSDHISKLPKPTKAQTDAVRADFKKGVRCQICGSWHHPDVVHLDYVGHAALTHRLLDADPEWSWEPVAFDTLGLPARDQNGGLWIRLTVCGVTRLGYGSADGKQGGDAIKEIIGDALRNAAMRFGAALDLWHKGDLHADDGADTGGSHGNSASEGSGRGPKPDRDAPFPQGPCKNKTDLKAKGRDLWRDVMACEDSDQFEALLVTNKALLDQLREGLPQWWGGGTREGEVYEGLSQVINKRRRDFADLDQADDGWRNNPVLAG